MTSIRFLSLASVVTACSMLISCSMIYQPAPSIPTNTPLPKAPTANFKDLEPAKRCLLLKRQMMYNTSNNNSEARWLARSQLQDLDNLYQANNCDQVLGR